MADRVYPAAKPNPPPAMANAGGGGATASFPAPKSQMYQRPIYRPQAAAAKRRRGRSCRCSFCCCFCWALLVVILLALVAAVAGGAFYLLYRPHRPSFTVSSVKAHRAQPLVVAHLAVAHRLHPAHRHRQEPQQEGRLPLRRLLLLRLHRRQRRPARRRHVAGLHPRRRQHHRLHRHHRRQRRRRRPGRRRLRHQEVRRLLRRRRRRDARRRQGGQPQDQEDRHPGALRGHQGDAAAARRPAAPQGGEGEERHRAGSGAGAGGLRHGGDHRRDGEHRGALVQGQSPCQDLEVDLLGTEFRESLGARMQNFQKKGFSLYHLLYIGVEIPCVGGV
ncbi:Os05g0199100 [Oryza sativa Japonica Group]|uniref:Os05g0199100 protein n=1 Tax=Oryza sativa subsp. japonica TaxID=39947 RepID=C7J2D2_ORYSJ|nr:Os05g0199100 [Oryza sativa Japonica Group]|eukprot:NP_001174268.1 Os05g0199100 [Oryza sativa Japonica Group]